VLVMYEGELVAELPREGLDEGQIGPYMLGANRQERRSAG